MASMWECGASRDNSLVAIEADLLISMDVDEAICRLQRV